MKPSLAHRVGENENKQEYEYRMRHSDVRASYKMTEHLYRYGTCRVHGQFKDERRNEWQENENNCATRTMLNLLQKV